MKYLILASLLFLSTFAFGQTANQWEIRKYTSSGMNSFWITGENSKAFGLNGSGVPAMLSISSGSTTLAGLTDVALSGLANSDLLRYNSGTAKWENVPGSTYALTTALNDYLTTATAASNYQPLDDDLTNVAGVSTQPFGRSLLAQTSSTALRSTLSLGALATLSQVNSSTITDFSITNGDIQLNAGIALSKLATTGTADNTTYLRGDGAWTAISSDATLAANTYTGLQQFSGTTHAGLRLNNLTTAERDALSSPQAGMAVWNTTDGRLQLHNGSGWTSGMVRLSGDTMTGALINSTNGALSAPALRLTGSYVTGGTGTTNVPLVLIEPAGTTASTSWSTTGTALGINIAAPSGTERMIDCRLAGASVFSVDRNGSIIGNFNFQCNGGISGLSFLVASSASADGTGYKVNTTNTYSWSGTGSWFGAADLILGRAAAASLQLGTNAASGTPTAQTIKGPNATAGQTNQPGGNLNIGSGLSTGNGAASVIISTSGNGAASTTLNTTVTRLTANASGVTIGANGTATPLMKHGTAVLVAGTVTVSDTDIVAGSRIFINRQTDGGTIGDSYSITRSAGVSFTITSKTANATVTGDTSTLSYLIINP